jgi:CheY-like chemotaxis protein
MTGQATGPSRRILVVDGNRDGADSLASMLRLMGNEMRTANDGVEAATEAERFRPEVILMDVKPVDLANLQWMGGGRTDRDRQNCATGAQKRRPFPARISRSEGGGE